LLCENYNHPSSEGTFLIPTLNQRQFIGGFRLNKCGTGGGGKMLVWRMISSSPAEHPRLGAEVDPYSETPPLALNPDRKPPLASE